MSFLHAALIEDGANSGLQVQVGGFVDDTDLIAYDASTVTNRGRLENAYKRWTQRHGHHLPLKNLS